MGGRIRILEGPVAITNTHSVGVVRDAIIAWEGKHDMIRQSFALPVVAETNDGWLNDINGFHVKPEHLFQALESASAGPVPEGNVGGGTGMHCYDFKGRAQAPHHERSRRGQAVIPSASLCRRTSEGANT